MDQLKWGELGHGCKCVRVCAVRGWMGVWVNIGVGVTVLSVLENVYIYIKHMIVLTVL